MNSRMEQIIGEIEEYIEAVKFSGSTVRILL